MRPRSAEAVFASLSMAYMSAHNMSVRSEQACGYRLSATDDNGRMEEARKNRSDEASGDEEDERSKARGSCSHVSPSVCKTGI